MQPHQRIAGTLMKDIFLGALPPGARLSPEKRLAEEVGADRGSLRVALKQLEAMNALEIRQGDGTYVKDFVKNVGLDFVSHLFELQAAMGGGEEWLDATVVDEIWEFWNMVFPEILKHAAKRSSTRDVKALVDIVNEELEHIADKPKLVELQVRTQDRIAEIVDNTIVLLFFNSSRPLRRKITEIFIHSVGDEEILKNIELRKALLKAILAGSHTDIDGLIDLFRERQEQSRRLVRTSLNPFSPASPTRGGTP